MILTPFMGANRRGRAGAARGFEGDRRKFRLWARKAIDHVLTLPKSKRA